MSKILNVNTGNYTIRVANGSTITFDTGATGNTALTGNLTVAGTTTTCLLYTSPSPRDKRQSRMPSSA